jgi:hypothetical protein
MSKDEEGLITRDQIYADLNLGSSEALVGNNAGTKAGLSDDLVENLQKDLEKLKRQSENILKRKTIAENGGVDFERTDAQKEQDHLSQLHQDLDEMNVHRIHASPRRLQVMRHQAAHLGSHT